MEIENILKEKEEEAKNQQEKLDTEKKIQPFTRNYCSIVIPLGMEETIKNYTENCCKRYYYLLIG